jgi:hypothetical protein
MLSRDDRVRQRELLWKDPDPVGPPSWPDPSVRRVLGFAFPVAHAALIDTHVTLRTVHGGHQGSGGVRRRGGGWLELADTAAVTTQGECRLLGALQVGRFTRVVPVEVVLAPWSATRSELRFQLHHGLSVPARYFDVAHQVLDNLSDKIQSRVDDLIEHRG